MSQAPDLQRFPPGSTSMVVSMRAVYGVIGLLFVVAVVGGLSLYQRIWGRTDGLIDLAFLLSLPVAVIGHEGLHGLAMVLCGVPLREVRFGVLPSRGAAFATTARPLAVGRYRFVCVLPLLVLGVAPLVAGIALGHHLAARLGAFMTMAAGGDVAVLFALRRVPPDALVVDHPNEPGCYVLPK